MALFPNRQPSKNSSSRTPQYTVPSTLNRDGRVLRFSGQGRMPGGQLYLDLVDGAVQELFLARVSHASVGFFLADLIHNSTVGPIRVRAGALVGGGSAAVGEVLLLGPLHFDRDQMACATHAWRLAMPVPVSVPPVVGRQVGVVSRIHRTGAFGEIVSGDGKRLFFHKSQMRQGPIQVGQQVSYTEALTDRGWNALDIVPH